MLKPHYQKFAELYASGVDPAEAYQMSCGQQKSKEACYKGAQRLSKNVHILAEVDRLRGEAQKSAGGTIVSLKEALEILSKIAREETMGAVRKVLLPAKVKEDENQPELFDPSEIPGPEMEMQVIYEKPKPADRMKALELLGRLERWFAEDRRDDSEADQIDKILDEV